PICPIRWARSSITRRNSRVWQISGDHFAGEFPQRTSLQWRKLDPLQTWDMQCNRVSSCIPADPCQSDRPAIRPCVGEPYETRSIEATRRAKSLPMTDFLHPWPPPSIRGPFAEVAHEAPY